MIRPAGMQQPPGLGGTSIPSMVSNPSRDPQRVQAIPQSTSTLDPAPHHESQAMRYAPMINILIRNGEVKGECWIKGQPCEFTIVDGLFAFRARDSNDLWD